jgi:hypothetical protein
MADVTNQSLSDWVYGLVSGDPQAQFPGVSPMPANPDALDKFLGVHVTDPIAAIWALLRLLSTPADPPPAPDQPLSTGIHEAQVAVQQVYYALIQAGAFSAFAWAIAYIVGGLVLLIAVVGELISWAAKILVPPIATAGLEYINTFRQTIDPNVSQLAVLVLNEIMGTNYTAAHLPTGNDVASHRARAAEIGQLYIDGILSTMGQATTLDDAKGTGGAAAFTGFIVNFGMATALLGLSGELGSLGFFKDFRLLGEQISSGLGLSRQMRLVLKPALKTLVATPFQWFLNERFFPQRFSLNEVVNPFQSTVMDHATIVKDLALQGWSPDRAEQLIKLHQKRLTVDEVETLRRWGHWSDDVATQYVTDLGWPADLVSTLLVLPELKRIDARMTKLVDALEVNVVDGHMSLDDFIAFIKTLPFTDDERAVIQATVAAKQKSPHKSLTLAELQTALEQGFITLADFDTFTTAMGFTSDQQLILDQLTLTKIAQFEQAVAVAQFAYDAKVAKAKAKNLPVPPKPKILAG